MFDCKSWCRSKSNSNAHLFLANKVKLSILPCDIKRQSHKFCAVCKNGNHYNKNYVIFCFRPFLFYYLGDIFSGKQSQEFKTKQNEIKHFQESCIKIKSHYNEIAIEMTMYSRLHREQMQLTYRWLIEINRNIYKWQARARVLVFLVKMDFLRK